MRESEVGADAAFDMILPEGSDKWKLSVIFMLGGHVIGAALASLIRGEGARAMVVTVYRSRYHDAGRTCEALRTAVEAQGVNCRGIREGDQSTAKRRVGVDRGVRVVQCGKARYAQDMVIENPDIFALMPCAFRFYEGNNGSLCIKSTKQMLMGKMFGGRVAGFMSGYFAGTGQGSGMFAENKRFDNPSRTTGVLWRDK